MKLPGLIVIMVLGTANAVAQHYDLGVIAFYNLENLYDTVNDSLIFDDDRTPEGRYRWNGARYKRKIRLLSECISRLGPPGSVHPPDILGVCEVENAGVLEELIAHPNLQKWGFSFIHFNSPDERGIDVALLYRQTKFHPTAMESRRLLLEADDLSRDYTRDILVVRGIYSQQLIHILVTHWPSRSGGVSRSRRKRIQAAALTRNIIDSLAMAEPGLKTILMGDFNDDPVDESMLKVVRPSGSWDDDRYISLYNPMAQLFKKGEGSLAYRDSWHLFDQIILSRDWLLPDPSGHSYFGAGIYKPEMLIVKRGRYKGYPHRTYARGVYTAGYSDHFPVYIVLGKRIHP